MEKRYLVGPVQAAVVAILSFAGAGIVFFEEHRLLAKVH
jgi:hypothetical protein